MKVEQSPDGVSDSAWKKTPTEVRQYVTSLRDSMTLLKNRITILEKQVKTIEYVNYDIIVTEPVVNTYMIQGFYSQGGKVEVIGELFDFEKSPELKKLQEILGTLAALSGDQHHAKKAGAIMRELLFPPTVWQRFDASCQDARFQRKRLRLRLSIEPPKLSMMPWEYCCDQKNEFLALNLETPVIRYVNEDFIPQKTEAPIPTRILLASASPSDWPSPDAPTEVLQIMEQLERLKDGEKVVIERENNLTVDSLQDHLSVFRPHILHFIGHGEYDTQTNQGAIILVDNKGRSRRVRPDSFANFLRGGEVKLVFLNACKTAAQNPAHAFMGIAPALVRAKIPAVIAMQFAIPNDIAIAFARRFYRSLTNGQTLDRAITDARNSIEVDERALWAIPVLFMGAQDGAIW
jgi:hypothetical protein